jgi:monoamine oxidase
MAKVVVDVCVVGAGLAGLSAIDFLLHSSEKMSGSPSIALLEARDRPGGRTQTIHLSDLQEQSHGPSSQPSPLSQSFESQEERSSVPFTVDVGGQWIGNDHFKALSLISKYGLKLEEQIYPHFGNDSNDSTGSSTNLLASLVSMVSYQFPDLTPEEESQVNQFVRLVDEMGAEISSHNHPWEMANATELDVSIFEFVQKTTPSPRAQQEIFIFIQTILATSPHDCSFLFFLSYIASGGGMRALGDGVHGAQRWKVVGGAQQISNLLLEDLLSRAAPSQLQHFFSTPVTSISSFHDSSGNRVVVQARGSSGETISITCRRVILAMSPRLANSSIQFTPPLPLCKQRLSEAMVPGACVKVLVPYAEEFWLTPRTGASGELTLGEIFPVHNMFHSSLGTFPALVGLITGDHARSYLQLSAEDRKAAVLNQIHQLFCPLSVGSREESPALQPITFLEKSWLSEEFSGGCFACLFRPHSFCSSGPALKTPLSYGTTEAEWTHVDPRLDGNLPGETAIEWASTETAPMFCGYMEGAILAGEETAQRILSSLS